MLFGGGGASYQCRKVSAFLDAPPPHSHLIYLWIRKECLVMDHNVNANLGRSPEPPHRSFHTLRFISSQTQTAQRGSIHGATHSQSSQSDDQTEVWWYSLDLIKQMIEYSCNVLVNCKKFHHQVVQMGTWCAGMGDTWQCVILNTTTLAAPPYWQQQRGIQMKIGSESELDKSYGRGAENKPANILWGKLQILLN